jgi:hypothetical protein
MADNVIDELIQKVKSQIQQDNPAGAIVQQDKDDFLTQVDGVIGIAANWAQLTTLVVDTDSAADIAAAAATAAAITGASTTGVGIAVLAVVLIIGLILTLAQKDSDGNQLVLGDLYKGIEDLERIVGAEEWITQMNNISGFLSPVVGDLTTITGGSVLITSHLRLLLAFRYYCTVVLVLCNQFAT